MTPRKIAILMHESDNELTAQRYMVSALVPIWEADGHDVFYLFGTRRFEAADVLFVHVDLSVLPRSYMRFARRYPAALNARVRDIRKSSFSSDLLSADDEWKGAVIVKTDRNYGGAPERNRLKGNRWRTAWNRVNPFASRRERSVTISHPSEYRIYDSLGQVPRECFSDPELVVQKFLPEREDGRFCLRVMTFLGNQLSCYRMKGSHPIINGATSEEIEIVDPDPRMVRERERLHFDYGKFDYVMHGGRPVLLDINKTIGRSQLQTIETDEMRELRRIKAVALYDYFR